MTNEEIESRMATLTQNERLITTEILALINLAEDRKLHLERGYSSLFAWLVQGYGYSESAAYRRIEAARLIRIVPEAADKIENGEVNLTTLAKARGAIRAQEKATGKKISAEEQAEVVRNIENKTSAETDTTLFQLFPESASSVHRERQSQVSETHTRLSFNLDAETMANLEWAKAFLSHSIPDGETSKVFARLLKEFRERNEKKDTSAAEKQSVSKAGAKRVSLHKAERKCEFVDEKTGRVCGAIYMVEVDHIRPRAMGGADNLKNYRCLCRAHNQYEAERKLGEFQANAWRRRRSG